MTDFETRAMEAKQASFAMAVLPTEVKNKALLKVADALIANKEAIFSANEIDLKNAKETDLPMPLQKRHRSMHHAVIEVPSKSPLAARMMLRSACRAKMRISIPFSLASTEDVISTAWRFLSTTSS